MPSSASTSERQTIGKLAELAAVSDGDGNRVAVVTYRVAHTAAEGRRSASYLRLIREAARQRGLPADYRAQLDRVEARD